MSCSALRWRDVDFAGSTIRVRASYAGGALTTPKSGKVRAVPMAPDVADGDRRAQPPARLGRRRRPRVPRRGRQLPRRLSPAPPVQGRTGQGGSPSAPLPRPPPHLRHPRDRQGRHPPRAGVDGPRRHPDHDALPPLSPRDPRARLPPRSGAEDDRPGRVHPRAGTRPEPCAAPCGARSAAAHLHAPPASVDALPRPGGARRSARRAEPAEAASRRERRGCTRPARVAGRLRRPAHAGARRPPTRAATTPRSPLRSNASSAATGSTPTG